MPTANKRVRGATSLDCARQVAEARLEFRAYRDNGGRYAWEIVDGRGDSVTRSAGFVTRADLERALRRAQHSASSTRFTFALPRRSEAVAV